MNRRSKLCSEKFYFEILLHFELCATAATENFKSYIARDESPRNVWIFIYISSIREDNISSM